MSRNSARAKWNTANSMLANKPFENLFKEKTFCCCENSVKDPDNTEECGICGKPIKTRKNKEELLDVLKRIYDIGNDPYITHFDAKKKIMEEVVKAILEHKKEKL